MRTYLRRQLLIGVGLLTAAGLSAAMVVGAAKPDPRVDTCGYAPSTNVVAAFDVSSARDLKTRIPGLALAPELDSDVPVSVVVFAGPITVRYPGRPDLSNTASDAEQTVSNIVCVIADGVPTYYADIDLAGWKQ